jgi:hypothetical protein
MNLRDTALAYAAGLVRKWNTYTDDTFEELARDITLMSPTPCIAVNDLGHEIPFDWFLTADDIPEIVRLAADLAAQTSGNTG